MIYTTLKNIKCIILDVDGVLTNGDILVNEQGDQLRTFNVKDGYAIQYAIKNGLKIFIITGAKSLGIQKRFQNLGVDEIHLGISDKLTLLNTLLEKHELSFKEALFIGDDIPDYKCMQQTAVAVSPADAAEEIKQISHIVSTKKGGEGVVRDIIEKIMKLQEKWHNDVFIKSI